MRSRLRRTRVVALAASARSWAGAQTWDFSLRRNFGLTESFKLRFQADIFNAFNRTNFRDLESNLNSAAFGTISTSGPPRYSVRTETDFLDEIFYLCHLRHFMRHRSGAYGDNGESARRSQHFLGKELAAHLSAIKSLDPPPERILGVPTTGEFSWGTFMRSLAAYAETTGNRELAGRDLAKWVGQIG